MTYLNESQDDCLKSSLGGLSGVWKKNFKIRILNFVFKIGYIQLTSATE
jgi:hypothetical protein